MIYEIKRGNTVLFSGLVAGQRKEAIMGVDVVNATFTLNSYIDFLKGDTMLIEGVVFILSKPSDFEQGGKWTYNLNFFSESYGLANAEMLGLDETGAFTEYECPFTGTADKVIDLILANINRVNPGWTKGTIDVTEAKDFDFTGDNCLNALTKAADGYGTEFWFEGKKMHLTKKGANSGLSFKRGKGQGLVKLIRKTLDNKAVTRLRVYGSKQNLPANYPGIAKRLKMPNGQLYIQDQAKVDKYGLNEEPFLFEDVYPRRTGTLTAVINHLTFTDTTLDFDINAQLINKVPAKIKFVTGQLAGYLFDIKSGGYNHATKTITINVNTDEKAIEVPSATGLKPAVGDKYILLDVIMPQSYITAAEIELKAKAEAKYVEVVDPRVQFEALTDRRYLREYNIIPKIGDFTNIKAPEAGIDKDIRIISKNTNLQDKYDISLELADTVSVAGIVKQIIAQDAVQKAIKNNKLNDIARQRLMWRTTSELSTMLDTLRGEMLLIMEDGGAYSTDISVEAAAGGNANRLKTSAGSIQHDEFIENGGNWTVSAMDAILPTSAAYYIYIKAARASHAATIVYSTQKIALNSDTVDYYFPFGIISSVINGTRIFTSTKGYTIITGNNIRTGRILSNDGLAWFDLDTREFKGSFKFISGRDVETAVTDLETAQESINDYITGVLPGEFADLQNQIDGNIESFFYPYDPTGANVPASEWNTPELKTRHGNDTFTNTNTGASWRWLFEDGAWKWKVIADTAVQAALAKAGQAQDTADSKRRNFVVQPFTPYDRGDTWSQGSAGEVMRCITTRLTGAFNAADWDKASKYTDDTRAVQAETNAKAYADAEIAGVNADVAQVAGYINDLDIYVDGAFKDGIIQEAEAKSIEKYLNSINAEGVDMDSRAAIIYNNPLLIDPFKYNVGVRSVEYSTAYTNLVNSISTAIADGKTTPAEKADVDAKFATYRTALSNFTTVLEQAINAIAQAKVNAVKIGGRNIFADGAFKFGMSNWIINGGNAVPILIDNVTGLRIYSSAQGHGIYSFVKLYDQIKTNTDYTISFDVRGISYDTTILRIGFNSLYNNVNVPNTSVWTRVSYVINTGPNPVDRAIVIYGTGNQDFCIAKFKIEEGNKATDFTEAPEDVDKAAQDKADAAYNAAVSAANTAYTNLTNSLKTTAFQDIEQWAIGGESVFSGGKLNVLLLDAAYIKANVINAAYMTGLDLNFTRGTIGGWIINSDSINSPYAGSLETYTGTVLKNDGTIELVSYSPGYRWNPTTGTWTNFGTPVRNANVLTPKKIEITSNADSIATFTQMGNTGQYALKAEAPQGSVALKTVGRVQFHQLRNWYDHNDVRNIEMFWYIIDNPSVPVLAFNFI